MHIDSATIIELGGREPQPDDSPEQRIASVLRNQRIYRELSDRCDAYQATVAMNKAKIQAYRERKQRAQKIADWRLEESRKTPLRMLAWLSFGLGFVYIPGVISNTVDMSSPIFLIWAFTWAGFGIVTLLVEFDSYLAIVILMVMPYWLLGPLPYLHGSYTWRHATKPKDA